MSHNITYYLWCILEAPQGGLEITLSRRFFGQITPGNCLKFMFTPSLPNHAGCQIDFSRNHAIIFAQFSFSRYEICPITPSRFPLGGPLPNPTCTPASWCCSSSSRLLMDTNQTQCTMGTHRRFNSQDRFSAIQFNLE